MLASLLIVVASGLAGFPDAHAHPGGHYERAAVTGANDEVAGARGGGAIGIIVAVQEAFDQRLAGALRSFREDTWRGTLLVIVLAFGYGLVHAAGPGHGKAIISAYVLANGETVRRGIAVSFLAAFMQALMALLLVGALAIVIASSGGVAPRLEYLLEVTSWFLILLVGGWLLFRQTRLLSCPHDAKTCGCDMSRLPSVHAREGRLSLRTTLPIVFAVGMRPCSGALILLSISIGQGLLWVGVLGTLAMALGTALAVAGIATLSIKARQWSIALWGRSGAIALRYGSLFGIVGAVMVIAIGAMGLRGALSG